VPLMLAVFFAKLVGDAIGLSVYDTHIKIKGAPVLVRPWLASRRIMRQCIVAGARRHSVAGAQNSMTSHRPPHHLCQHMSRSAGFYPCRSTSLQRCLHEHDL
jgi:hypothetical protein